MKNLTQTPQFGSIISNACTILCGLPLILSFLMKIGQMVICPVRGTYNQETNLTRVNSFNNICFKFKIDLSAHTRQFSGNTANVCSLPGGSPFTLFVSQDLSIGRLNVYISSKLLSSPTKLKFYLESSDGNMYNQWYMSPRH